MPMTTKKEVIDRIRQYLIEACQDKCEDSDCEGDCSNPSVAVKCVYNEFKDEFGWKVNQVGEYNAFKEWLLGLALNVAYTYYDEKEIVRGWLGQSEEEADKYDDYKTNELYWNLLTREFFKLVRKFKADAVTEGQQLPTASQAQGQPTQQDNSTIAESDAVVADDYNGWANRETWNVMLWINNDEGLYNAAVDFMSNYNGDSPYKEFIKYCGLNGTRTQDGVKWISDKLDYDELNDAMKEFDPMKDERIDHVLDIPGHLSVEGEPDEEDTVMSNFRPSDLDNLMNLSASKAVNRKKKAVKASKSVVASAFDTSNIVERVNNYCKEIVEDAFKTSAGDLSSVDDLVRESIDGSEWLIYTQQTWQLVYAYKFSESEDVDSYNDSGYDDLDDIMTSVAYNIMYRICDNYIEEVKDLPADEYDDVTTMVNSEDEEDNQ